VILLSTVIDRFSDRLEAQYGHRLLPGHRRALSALKRCRTQSSRQMLACCTQCEHKTLIPHSCGHRLCPHCQHFESQRWLETQQSRLVPAEYFLVTFTVPTELRSTAYAHQRLFYDALMHSAWRTLSEFSENDKELRGRAGAIAVLHTHSRRLAYHPHVHVVIPAAAINTRYRCWRTRAKEGFLFPQKALASVFRGKLLARLNAAGLSLPASTPPKWVVDCQAVGRGDKAITYLGRYLYRGVISEKNIVDMDSETITYRYTDNTGTLRTRTVRGERFLWLLVQHTLPKGFRRARNYGFLHSNSKTLIQLLQVLLLRSVGSYHLRIQQRPSVTCSSCGGTMNIVAIGLCLNSIRTDTEPLTPGAVVVM